MTSKKDKAIEEVYDILSDMHDGIENCLCENSDGYGCLACKCQGILNGVRGFKSAQRPI